MIRAIADHGLSHRVIFEDRWISEEEKVERLATALAVAYVPDDEDSYGYPSLEAAHARKAVLTASDSGGVLELVSDVGDRRHPGTDLRVDLLCAHRPIVRQSRSRHGRNRSGTLWVVALETDPPEVLAEVQGVDDLRGGRRRQPTSPAPARRRPDLLK